MATPPTFVASYGNTAFSSSTQTASVTVAAGDLIVIGAGTTSGSSYVNTPTGGGLTYTLQQSIVNITQQSCTYVWTAVSPSAQTFTLTMSGTDYYAWVAEVWRNHNGVGASAKKTAKSTTSLSLTTQSPDSAIFMVDNDWAAVVGTSRSYLTSVSAFTEKAYQYLASGGTFYGGHYADSGAVGSKTVGMSAPSGQYPSLIALEVLAAPAAATGSLAITATALLANTPPAVRIDVSDTRSPGQASALTIVRNNPDGSQSPVRTSNGNPLPLSGGVGLVYDFEMPLGQAVSYTALEVPGVTSLQVTVTSSRPWLVHTGVPALSMQLPMFMPGSFTKRTRPVVRGVFRPLGRVNAVTVTDGARKGIESSFAVLAQTASQQAAIDAITADASTLLLNIPAGSGINFSTCYVSIGDMDYAPVIDKVTEQWLVVTFPFTVVDRPAGGSQSGRAYVDVLAGNSSYATLRTGYNSYQALLAGP